MGPYRRFQTSITFERATVVVGQSLDVDILELFFSSFVACLKFIDLI